jgi:hypothetical protein
MNKEEKSRPEPAESKEGKTETDKEANLSDQVKNAHATGLGAMGRSDEQPEIESGQIESGERSAESGSNSEGISY